MLPWTGRNSFCRGTQSPRGGPRAGAAEEGSLHKIFGTAGRCTHSQEGQLRGSKSLAADGHCDMAAVHRRSLGRAGGQGASSSAGWWDGAAFCSPPTPAAGAQKRSLGWELETLGPDSSSGVTQPCLCVSFKPHLSKWQKGCPGFLPECIHGENSPTCAREEQEAVAGRDRRCLYGPGGLPLSWAPNCCLTLQRPGCWPMSHQSPSWLAWETTSAPSAPKALSPRGCQQRSRD